MRTLVVETIDKHRNWEVRGCPIAYDGMANMYSSGTLSKEQFAIRRVSLLSMETLEKLIDGKLDHTPYDRGVDLVRPKGRGSIEQLLCACRVLGLGQNPADQTLFKDQGGQAPSVEVCFRTKYSISLELVWLKGLYFFLWNVVTFLVVNGIQEHLVYKARIKRPERMISSCSVINCVMPLSVALDPYQQSRLPAVLSRRHSGLVSTLKVNEASFVLPSLSRLLTCTLNQLPMGKKNQRCVNL